MSSDSLCPPSRDGPGESVRVMLPLWRAGFEASEKMREAPQSSQESREGWFSKVHRGHWNADCCVVELLFSGKDES